MVSPVFQDLTDQSGPQVLQDPWDRPDSLGLQESLETRERGEEPVYQDLWVP